MTKIASAIEPRLKDDFAPGLPKFKAAAWAMDGWRFQVCFPFWGYWKAFKVWLWPMDLELFSFRFSFGLRFCFTFCLAQTRNSRKISRSSIAFGALGRRPSVSRALGSSWFMSVRFVRWFLDGFSVTSIFYKERIHFVYLNWILIYSPPPKKDLKLHIRQFFHVFSNSWELQTELSKKNRTKATTLIAQKAKEKKTKATWLCHL